MNKEPADEARTPQSGRKKILIVVVLLLIAAIGGVICMALPPREPSYNGQPLSYWLARCEETGPISADIKDPKARECREAIRHIGTNAIPFLLRMLRAKDSALKLELIDLVE